MAAATPKFDPIVSIVGFHHARGPEVEHWIGVEDETTLSEWPLLPFMALSDGAHSLDSSSEDFSYFTLKHMLKKDDGVDLRPVSLFGISCTRQLDSSTLIDRPPEVTRSTVQKAVVVIAESPVYFGGLKEKLGMVTRAWFAQRNFEDLDIIRKFQESLKFSLSVGNDQYLGLSLRELVFEFRQQTLVLFKCCLLQPKMLFFGTRCDRLCMTQFSLLSLIPGLLGALEDCADPELNYYEGRLFKPTSVRTSDRKSLLTFMGMPLQIFGKGSLFGPYTPLQQLDILADVGTKSYIVGSTNSLLLQQKDRYSDILINLDEHSVNISSPTLRTALYLTAADRRWIDSVVQAVADSWDENDPSRPNTMGFVGSEDYIRLQFEEYALSMVSSVKCHDFLEKHAGSASRILPDVDGDPATDFGLEFIDMWKKTENYRIFQKFTDSELFDLVPPKHVMAGGLTMDDVSRRISQQLNDLKLDEKMVNGREAVAKTFVAGRGKLGAAFSTLTSNVASLREAQAKKLSNPEPKSPAPSITPSVDSTEASEKSGDQPQPAKGGYFSAWASWAGEKKRKAFGGTPAQTPSSSPPLKATSNSEVTSAAPSIGSPKVPVTKRGRDSYAEDIYDAETGIAKVDSGFISPPYRASLDMHPHVQAQRNGTTDTQEHKPELESSKGIFSVIAEQFQMVDIRKSLPPPPPPEKEPVPEMPVKSEEDREFLRNLRKSLPPPPSEIDFLPNMLVAPGPPPGPLVAQEASNIEPVSEPIEPPRRSLLRESRQSIATDKAATEALPRVEELSEPSATSEAASYTEEATEPSALAEHPPYASPEAQELEKVLIPVSPPRESRTARLKARNLLHQYIAQEKAAQALPSVEYQAKEELTEAPTEVEGQLEPVLKAHFQTQDNIGTPVSATRESRPVLLEDKDSVHHYLTPEHEPQAPASTAIEKDPVQQPMRDEPSVPFSRPPSTKEEDPVPQTQELTTQDAKTAEPKGARFKARGLIRKYVAQEQEMELQRSQVDHSAAEEHTAQASPAVQEKPDQQPIAEQSVRLSQAPSAKEEDTVLPTQELPIQEALAVEPKAARFKARGLIRRYVAQEQEAEVQRSQIIDHFAVDEHTAQAIEPFEPSPIQRTRTRTLSQGEALRSSPTIPRTVSTPTQLKRRSTRAQTPELTREPIQRAPTIPLTPEPVSEPVKRTPTHHEATERTPEPVTYNHTLPMDSPVLGHGRSQSRSNNSAESKRHSKRKSIPAFTATSPPEAESHSREEAAEPLKISKRRSTMKVIEDAFVTPESPEATIQMKRKSLRSIGGDYASLEAAFKDKEKDKDSEKEKEKGREKLQTVPSSELDSPPPPLIKRKTIPAVFAQAEAELEQKPKLSRATTGVGSLPRTPSPGLSATSNVSSTSHSPSERKIGRSRSGTVAQGPPSILALNKATSPPMPALPNLKELNKHSVRTPSPTKDVPSATAERARMPSSIITRALRAPSIDGDTPPLSPGKIAVAESRTGPGRIGGGLKDNPFLKNDIVSPTGGGDGLPVRKRVGTLQNNPFIKNDVKSPTSPPPGGAR